MGGCWLKPASMMAVRPWLCGPQVSAEVGNITLEQQLSTQSLIEQTIRYRYPQQYQLIFRFAFLELSTATTV
ncbi:hypothetical protein OH492_12680 [Vibrio chagasii]|nr:hypothetical protein [Vibrio chagasii]